MEGELDKSSEERETLKVNINTDGSAVLYEEDYEFDEESMERDYWESIERGKRAKAESAYERHLTEDAFMGYNTAVYQTSPAETPLNETFDL